jgi:release factor glutamine methyltransferase
MKNSKILFQDFINRITVPEDREEILGIAYLVFESVLGTTRTDILAGKPVVGSVSQLSELEKIITRVNQHEPIQYVLGEAHFFGRKFKVNRHVLIPRPETEELVREVKDFLKTKKKSARVLDIGTGSGCIAVTLALEFPDALVFATDKSPEALAVAEENSEILRGRVSFFKHDILQSPLPLSDLDVVVSNPPYITKHEVTNMKSNVVQFEPHMALFVPDDDPLIFYKMITSKAYDGLNKDGALTVEVNEKFGREVCQIFFEAGFRDIRVVKDISGKDRIVTGRTN